MPLLRFVVFTGLGGLIWASVFVGLGWLFSHQLEAVAAYMASLGSWVIALLAAAFGAYIVWKWVARQRFLRRIRIARITPEELKAKLDAGEDTMVVDVRHPVDFVRHRAPRGVAAAVADGAIAIRSVREYLAGE